MLSALPATDESGRPNDKECIYEKCRFFEREQRDCSLMMSSRAMLRVAEQLDGRPPGGGRDPGAATAITAESSGALAAEVARAVTAQAGPALAAEVARAVAAEVTPAVAALVQGPPRAAGGADAAAMREALREAQESAADRASILEAQIADLRQTLALALRDLESRIAARPEPAPQAAPAITESLTAVRVTVEEGFQALAARLDAAIAARPDPSSLGSDLASLRRALDEGFLTLATRLDSKAAGRAERAAGQESAALREAIEQGLKALTLRLEQQARAIAASVPVADQVRKDLAALSETQQRVAEKVLEEMSLVGLNSHRLEQTVAGMEKKVEKYVNDTGHIAQVLTLVKGETERTFAALRSINEGNRAVIKAIETQLQRDQSALAQRRKEEALQSNNRGVVLYYRGALDAAVEAFQKAVTLEPDYAEAHNNLGLALSKLGRAQEAVEAFQRALKLDPRMGEAYNNLGFLFHTAAQFERAVEMFGRAVETSADSSVAYTNLGNSFYRLKQPEKAVAAWRRALELDPMNENARRGLRMFEQDAGRN
jgi:tetratricopeptide (TPR) repeat protein